MNRKNHYRILERIYLFLGAFFFASLAIIFSYYGVLEKIDQQISDTIYQAINYSKAKTDVQIISIDEKTVSQLGAYETWSRSQSADLIKMLNESGYAPAVIGIDLDYTESEDSAGDQELMNTCRQYDNICLSASVTMENKLAEEPKNLFDIFMRHDDEEADTEEAPPEETGTNKTTTGEAETAMSYEPPEKAELKPEPASGPSMEDLPKDPEGSDVSSISLPFAGLLPYIHIGVVNNVKNSPDGIARNAVASVNVNGEEYDSFAVAVYKMYMDSLGKAYSLPKLDDDNTFGFTYTRQSKDYPVYSFYDVISGNVDLSVFHDSIVYVGDYTEQNTSFYVPNQRHTQMHEIEVQANILEAILTNRTGQAIPASYTAIFYAIFAAVFFLATSYSSNLRTVLAAVLLFLLAILVCGILNLFGYYILILIPAGLVVMITIFNLSVRYWVTRYHSYKMETTFKKYVDESVVNEIVQNRTLGARIGGVKKDIAVLFVDIRGFTSLSESLDPEQIVEILNKYLTLVAKAIAKNNGTLDKFIGDAAMAVFNSPSDLEDYEYLAVHAAWDLLASAQKLNQFCQKQYGKPVTFGIGIQCGEAVIGNIGCESRMDFTAIGDTVNTASRLEGIAAPGQILISEEMNRRLQGRIQTEFAGEFNLKGKKQAVPAYTVTGVYERLPGPSEQ